MCVRIAVGRPFNFRPRFVHFQLATVTRILCYLVIIKLCCIVDCTTVFLLSSMVSTPLPFSPRLIHSSHAPIVFKRLSEQTVIPHSRFQIPLDVLKLLPFRHLFYLLSVVHLVPQRSCFLC